MAFGLACLIAFSVFVTLQNLDMRTLQGVNVWVKPAKFAISIGLFALTQAYFLSLVRAERQGNAGIRYVVWGTILSAGFELAYIAFQAARGEASHFNLTTGLHIAMYALMGVGAVALVLTMVPLAFEIGKYAVPGLPPLLKSAIVAGLVFSTVATLVVAGYMSQYMGHSVGADHGQFPLMGWNRSGGDLRVAHFFALHAQQAFPLVAWGLTLWPKPLQRISLLGFVSAYAALVLYTFVDALQGHVFLGYLV
jgi:hypothetical protein